MDGGWSFNDHNPESYHFSEYNQFLCVYLDGLCRLMFTQEEAREELEEGWMYLPYRFSKTDPHTYLEFRNNYTSWHIMNDLQARISLEKNDSIIPAHVLAEGIDFMVEQGYWH